MSFGNTTETDLGQLIFQATALSWGSATELDIHLHVGDPGEGGNATASSPATYTGYLPVTVDRAGTDWTTTGAVTTNDNLIQFPICAGGTNAITHASISPQGSTQIIVSGALSGTLNVSSDIQPQFAANAITITID